MTAGHGTTVRRRRLRFELRKEREAAGLTQDQVAREMEWSLSKIIRIEAGAVGISTNDLKALLQLYRVEDEQRITALLDLARSARARTAWWTAYREQLTPALAEYIGYEAEASVLRVFHPYLIPGLLQTEDYARAIFADGGPQELTDQQIETLLEIRLTRQQDVLDRRDPPKLVTVLGEAALRVTVGGVAAFRDQLQHLITAGQKQHVTIQVVPFTAGAHPGLAGAFAIVEFPDPIDDDVLTLDSAASDVIVRDQPETLSEYRQAFDRLRALSLPPEQSLELISTIADSLTG